MMDDFIISRDAYFLILIEKFQVEDPFKGLRILEQVYVIYFS